MDTWDTHGISLGSGIREGYFELRKKTGWVVEPCGTQSRDIEIYGYNTCSRCGKKYWGSSWSMVCDGCKKKLRQDNARKLRMK